MSARRGIGLKNDCAVLAPRPAATVRSVAQRDGHTARGSNLLQLAACEKSDPVAVGRKERALGVVGPRQRHRLQLGQWSNVDLGASTFVSLRYKRNGVPCGREAHGGSRTDRQ